MATLDDILKLYDPSGHIQRPVYSARSGTGTSERDTTMGDDNEAGTSRTMAYAQGGTSSLIVFVHMIDTDRFIWVYRPDSVDGERAISS